MANRPERPPLMRFSREEFSGSDAEYDLHIQEGKDRESLRMSEQKREFTKLKFAVKAVPRKSHDNFLTECDRLLLEDWDRRFHEADRINSVLEDLDKDSL